MYMYSLFTCTCTYTVYTHVRTCTAIHCNFRVYIYHSVPLINS